VTRLGGWIPLLIRSHAEENHRWTQMNTDSEGWIPVLLPLALGHRPVNGVPPSRSAVLSSPYLCLSVSICGWFELSRLRLIPYDEEAN
jgi:hypothetical protein